MQKVNNDNREYIFKCLKNHDKWKIAYLESNLFRQQYDLRKTVRYLKGWYLNTWPVLKLNNYCLNTFPIYILQHI